MKTPLVLAAAALAAGLTAAAPAHASLVLLDQTTLRGQGVGAASTLLSLQAAGNSTTESGGVLFNGNTFGDAKNGASVRDVRLCQLGNFEREPAGANSEPCRAGIGKSAFRDHRSQPAATNANLANAITLNVYSASGVLLEQHTTAAGQTLNQTQSGVGGSGIVFGLTPTEQAQLNATMAANAGLEVFTVGATFGMLRAGLMLSRPAFSRPPFRKLPLGR
jgi:hypothetical protein